METEKMKPLELLVQSITKQQQAKSDLANRLAHLTSQLGRHVKEMESLVFEEKSLRRQLADIIRSNIALETRTIDVVQNCEMEHQSCSSLALTLDGLNEQRLSLQNSINDHDCANSKNLLALNERLKIEGDNLSNLLGEKGNHKMLLHRIIRNTLITIYSSLSISNPQRPWISSKLPCRSLSTKGATPKCRRFFSHPNILSRQT